MALYAIGDLHLSLGAPKPMDIFGGAWHGYMDKLREAFSQTVGPEDVTVLCGDLCWAMTLEEALPDFHFVHNLPGRKILLKGNHEYWWSSASKIQTFLDANGFDSVSLLHNNFLPYGDTMAICGTRGWFYEEGSGSAHDKKLMDREVLRLESSLRQAGDREKLVFLHYPPVYGSYVCPEILALLRQYAVTVCCSGHLHADSLRLAFNGELDGTRFHCVSADALAFRPLRIAD